MKSAMKKVLIVNASNNVALAIARGLGRAGVPLAGVGWKSEGGVGLDSRYFHDKVWIDGSRALQPTL